MTQRANTLFCIFSIGLVAFTLSWGSKNPVLAGIGTGLMVLAALVEISKNELGSRGLRMMVFGGTLTTGLLTFGLGVFLNGTAITLIGTCVWLVLLIPSLVVFLYGLLS